MCDEKEKEETKEKKDKKKKKLEPFVESDGFFNLKDYQKKDTEEKE